MNHLSYFAEKFWRSISHFANFLRRDFPTYFESLSSHSLSSSAALFPTGVFARETGKCHQRAWIECREKKRKPQFPKWIAKKCTRPFYFWPFPIYVGIDVIVLPYRPPHPAKLDYSMAISSEKVITKKVILLSFFCHQLRSWRPNWLVSSPIKKLCTCGVNQCFLC